MRRGTTDSGFAGRLSTQELLTFAHGMIKLLDIMGTAKYDSSSVD